MRSYLSNHRFLALPSESLGEDWLGVSHALDSNLGDLNLELAEESVYLIYDRAPGALLNGEGTCLIARPVIGPQTAPVAPLRLFDWSSRLSFEAPIKAREWRDILQESQEEWERLTRENPDFKGKLVLRVKRRLETTLQLSVESLFLD